MSSKAPRRFIIFVLSSPEQQRCYKSAGQRVGDKRESGREKGGASRRTKGLSDKSGARWMPKSVPGASALRQAGRPGPGLLAAPTPSSSDWLLGCQ